MYIFKIAIVSLLLIVFYTGCNERTTDTTNDKTIKTPIEEVKNSLPLDKQKDEDAKHQKIKQQNKVSVIELRNERAKRLNKKATGKETLHELDSFTVNLASDNGRKKIFCILILQLNNQLSKNEITTNLHLIRGTITKEISSFNLEEVFSKNGKLFITEKIIVEINKKLLKGNIIDIYITEMKVI